MSFIADNDQHTICTQHTVGTQKMSLLCEDYPTQASLQECQDSATVTVVTDDKLAGGHLEMECYTTLYEAN